MRPNNVRAKAAIVFLAIILFLYVAQIISCVLQANLLKAIATGTFPDADKISGNDFRHATIIIAIGIVTIGCAITFIMWFRRAYYNMHQKTAYLKHAEGWAAGAWFVPILNLFRPVEIMSEMNRESKQLLVGENLMEPEKKLGAVIAVWWSLWILVRVIGGTYIYFQSKSPFSSINQLISRTHGEMYVAIGNMILAGVAILMIRLYMKREELMEKLDSSGRRNMGDSDLLDAML